MTEKNKRETKTKADIQKERSKTKQTKDEKDNTKPAVSRTARQEAMQVTQKAVRLMDESLKGRRGRIIAQVPPATRRQGAQGRKSWSRRSGFGARHEGTAKRSPRRLYGTEIQEKTGFYLDFIVERENKNLVFIASKKVNYALAINKEGGNMSIQKNMLSNRGAIMSILRQIYKIPFFRAIDVAYIFF